MELIRKVVRMPMSMVALVLVGLLSFPSWSEETPSREQLDYFETHIRPVFVERCYSCHSAKAKKLQGGLRLDTAAGTRRGGDSGPAIIPHKPAESLLLESLRYESYEMPPDGKLPDQVVAHFERWIELGAPDPRRDDPDPEPTEEQAPADDAAKHWAF